MVAIEKRCTYRLTGNTFAAKEIIKKIGGTWDKPGQFWIVQTGGMREIGEQRHLLEKVARMGVTIEEM